MINKYGRYFYIESINGLYYHIILSEQYDDDFDIAKVLGLNIKQYHKLLINNFQAKGHYDIVVFTKISDLKKAIIYIEDLYVARLTMSKLIKK